jgi:hypothetical protein
MKVIEWFKNCTIPTADALRTPQGEASFSSPSSYQDQRVPIVLLRSIVLENVCRLYEKVRAEARAGLNPLHNAGTRQQIITQTSLWIDAIGAELNTRGGSPG